MWASQLNSARATQGGSGKLAPQSFPIQGTRAWAVYLPTPFSHGFLPESLTGWKEEAK